MTIKHNYIAYLGCVVDGMSIVFHVSKFGKKCNDKQGYTASISRILYFHAQ